MNKPNIPLHELRAHALFMGLSDDSLMTIIDGVQLVQLAECEHLFTQEQPADRFFMLRRGQVKLYRLSPTGHEKVIEIVRPGQCFAEAVMFMDVQCYPVSAQALVACELYAIDNLDFLNVLRGSVDTSFRVMANMSVRLHQLLNEIDALTLQNATLRLVNYLLGQVPADAELEADVSLPAAKNIIASRLSVQPETLSRILHSLSNQGLITVKGANVQIHDVKKLRAHCE
ncbi:MAG: Crp/Fnr family transcriptional regulator [Thiohalomonadaceae bacterium]